MIELLILASILPLTPTYYECGNIYQHRMYVTITAYNSVAAQTDSSPDIAAWGDKIAPGMKLVAVSRDLLRSGLTRNVPVCIPGVDKEEYRVLDKMNRRFRSRIDLYMGEDIHAARRWGRRSFWIYY